ncbi:hypothetical protein GE115_06445 [Agromyces sp. CFH 90414]|uniref:Glycosyl hydrolase family 67 C-terminal domain-containing protein n=1 Tax=Agromyces agglutinans TaxID=2662258 RepID=A0A6I2F4H4_9MICO|nr:hypothetical protein [Agromyces agglutinans]MRG59512.1 hypothetical protein [Agromyces agglutinans]
MTRTRRSVTVGIALTALLALGAGVAFVVGDELGIRSEAADVPLEHPTAAPESPAVAPPEFTSIDAPASPRLDLAVGELRDAVGDAVATSGAVSLQVVVGGGAADGTSADRADAAGQDAPADETYRLEGDAASLRIVADAEAGAVRGVYDIAAAVRDRRSVSERLGETVTSRLGFRMVDLGAVGVSVDETAWAAGDDYSHHSKAFADVILPGAPYIDEAALEVARADFDAYLRHVLAEGYTAIAIPGFIEYLTFDRVGDGHEVYDADDEHVARALAMREAFGPMWEQAHELGLDVYFRTDMLTLTTPLEEYLTERFGSLATEDPAFWSVYAAGLDELYAQMPYVDGVLVRIGEAGRVYDLPGWDYYSELGVTTVDAVRAMLTALTDQAERADREVIFRSWSVGVGAVGDMHTNVDSYHAVLDGIDSEKLVVSTKYTLGDFYSHLPFNDTLEVGEQRRIVEFQSRREFENFGAFPNDLGEQYRGALQRFLAANPRVEGIWTWTQDGGPWRAGPLALELKAGFWQLYELNTELAVRLARDPETDPAAITADWARRWFSDDPATVRAIGEAMSDSRTAITDGLYIGPFADRRVFAIGLEPPPMMWIFEWDILTGDSAVLDVIYDVSRDDLDEAIAGGERALAAVEGMHERIAATDASTWRDASLRDEFLATLDYQASTFAMLGDYREMFLRQAQWHDTLDPVAHEQWDAARRAFEASAAAHEAAYAGDPYHPAYNLTAARIGVERAERDLPMAWAARILLVLLVAWVAYGVLAGRSRFARLAAWPGARAARALWVAGTRPWRAAEATAALGALDRALLLAVPAVLLAASRGIQTWFLAPAHLAVTLGSWLVFVLVVLLVLRLLGRRPAWPVLAAIGGAATLRVALLLVALVPSGPGGYWFGFWTDPVARSLYVTVAFAAFGWVLVAVAWALAGAVGGRRALGAVVTAVGTVLAAAGALIGLVGLEAAVTEWNDQMSLLPWGLSRILGITVYLDIPADTAWWVAAMGAAVAVAGVLLAIPWRRAARPGRAADGTAASETSAGR